MDTLAHSPIVADLVDLVETNRSVREQIDNVLREGDRAVGNVCRAGRLADLIEFFNEWYWYLPIPGDELRYISRFHSFCRTEAGNGLLADVSFRQWLARFVAARGAFLDSDASAVVVDQWLESPGVDVDEMEIPTGGFQSFNQFFTRRLKTGSRPIDRPFDRRLVVSPADCQVDEVVPIRPGATMVVKGRKMTASSLLDNDTVALDFNGGCAVTLSLWFQNYHRFHAPLTADVIATKQIGGLYFVSEEKRLLEVRRRGYLVFDSQELGLVALVAVGMENVSSIQFSGEKARSVSKGDELGFFAYGGSAMVMLFSNSEIELFVRAGQELRVGQRFATLPG
ncbi:MAG: phosphatidylserine decarboxylase [Pirellulales bacterium]